MPHTVRPAPGTYTGNPTGSLAGVSSAHAASSQHLRVRNRYSGPFVVFNKNSTVSSGLNGKWNPIPRAAIHVAASPRGKGCGSVPQPGRAAHTISRAQAMSIVGSS